MLLCEPADPPPGISNGAKGAPTINHLLYLSPWYRSKKETSSSFWKVPAVNSPMEGAHWRYLPMCCSSVARLHHRLFKPPSRCGAISLTAVTLPPLWLLLTLWLSRCSYSKWISTHTYIHVHANMSTHTEYPILIVASSCDLYSWDLFLFTQTLTTCKLELVPHWRESACHISIVVFWGLEKWGWGTF